jgi:hypothetical protein
MKNVLFRPAAIPSPSATLRGLLGAGSDGEQYDEDRSILGAVLILECVSDEIRRYRSSEKWTSKYLTMIKRGSGATKMERTRKMERERRKIPVGPTQKRNNMKCVF